MLYASRLRKVLLLGLISYQGLVFDSSWYLLIRPVKANFPDLIRKLLYLEMCIKETLRKYPVFPFVDRRCNTNYKIPGTKIIIEKETPCVISTMGLHHDPKYYPNPEIFDRERFSKTNNNQSPFLPFGDGPRGCIGKRFGMLTTKLGLAYIIKSFIVETCDQTQKKIKFEPKSVNGIKLKFVRNL